MPRKPIVIIIIALICLISPLFIILNSSIANMIPLTGPSNIFMRLAVADLLVLLLYPIMAVAIFSVRKSGWWIFIVSSAILISYNVYSFIQNPFVTLPSLLIFNLILVVTALIFFRKHLIAPYFSPEIRWWESDKRFKIHIEAIFPTEHFLTAQILDISRTGCYISSIAEPLHIGESLPMTIRFYQTEIHLIARIIRYSEFPFPGFGIQFIKIDKITDQGLKSMLDELKRNAKHHDRKSNDKRVSERYKIPLSIAIERETPEGIIESLKAIILNISKSGCALTVKGKVDPDSKYTISFNSISEGFQIESSTIWISQHNNYTICGFAYRAKKEDKKELKNIVKYFIKLGAKTRRDSAIPDKILIEKKAVEDSPLRFFVKN